MEIFMVGVFRKGKTTNGFRLLSIESNGKTETKDVAYSLLLDTIKAGLVKIQNLKIEDNKLKGVNGSIDRYGTVGKSQALVILRELQDSNNKFSGYLCSDTMGNTRSLSESEALTFADKLGIANGKVVASSTGEKRISSIDGNYNIMKIQYDSVPKNTPTQQPQVNQQIQATQVQSQNNEQAVDKYYADAINLIDALELRKEFKNSFAQKVSLSIKKYKKCSEKQYKIIKDFYDKITTAEPAKTEPAKTEPAKTEPAKTEPATSDNKKELPKVNDILSQPLIIGAPETDMDSVLVYQIMKDGNVYVKGIRKDLPDDVIDNLKTLVIPETTILNGKTYKITGINVAAFANAKIEEVKTSANINDIGQEAFMLCNKLKYVDFSASKHNHLSMNLFRGCKNLLQINTGNYVQRVHEGAFIDCTSLSAIELPDMTDTIARNAFFGCKSLYQVKHNAKFINDSAFRDCEVLENISLKSVNQIGAHAFRNTGFKHLTIPGNVNSLGSKAFADCLNLSEIVIEEGVEEIGEYCFAKLRERDVRRKFGKDVSYTAIKLVHTPKSIISVLNGAFMHCELVRVWTGSVCESHCVGFNIPYERIDESNLDNSTKTRIKSEMIGSNHIEMLYRLLTTDTENASNPELELRTDKLVDIAFSDSQMDFFKLSKTTDIVEPHIKFKAIVNYLQDVSNLFTLPLSNPILRLQNTFYVNTKVLFDDGCNRICKVTYTIMDTLESGSYIMVLMNNKLRYTCECNMTTDIELENSCVCNDNIPVNKFLHAGDTIGVQATIGGKDCKIEVDGSIGRVNVGEILLYRLERHGITFQTTKRDSILYIPACNVALNLHDGRIWDKPGVISDSTKDCLNLLNIYTYDEMKQAIKKSNKSTYNESKLFSDLAKLSDREVALRNKYIDTIDDEKEAQLFQVSKQFRQVVDAARLNEKDITPNIITPQVFNELSRSYWMVHKDSDWLNSVGTKSLNKINEFNIGNYKLIEYKSNQIVKFSNPYMNGKKGAYIFTLMQNNNILGVYASRYDMGTIVKKLYNLTDLSHLPEGTEIPELMTSAENIDKVHPSLFYNFYDVLQSKNGWSFNTLYSMYNYGVSFHIAMYKPTGVFYLTMERVSIVEDKKDGANSKLLRGLRVMPILPIGNMDRALMVATTTNTNNKDSALLKELLGIMTLMEIQDHNMRLHYNERKEQLIQYTNNYIEARKLVINRVKDVAQYKKLIDDRAVYMLGTLHSGVLQREFSEMDFDDEIDIMDIDMSEFDDMEDEIDDSDIDIDIDDTDEEISLDDEMISFEEFYETAKSMGITDEGQARIMYLNFINQQ